MGVCINTGGTKLSCGVCSHNHLQINSFRVVHIVWGHGADEAKGSYCPEVDEERDDKTVKLMMKSSSFAMMMVVVVMIRDTVG